MVRAIIEGRKTQTRRICKPAEKGNLSFVLDIGHGLWGDEEGEIPAFACPYGRPGDRLWVREAYYYIDLTGEAFYRATGDSNYTAKDLAKGRAPLIWPGPWKPSIHMPRWASRITLKIKSVRCERLQDISEADAIAEGASEYRLPTHPDNDKKLHVMGFASLWESINGPGAWDANPWVWAIEFERVTI